MRCDILLLLLCYSVLNVAQNRPRCQRVINPMSPCSINLSRRDFKGTCLAADCLSISPLLICDSPSMKRQGEFVYPYPDESLLKTFMRPSRTRPYRCNRHAAPGGRGVSANAVQPETAETGEGGSASPFPSAPPPRERYPIDTVSWRAPTSVPIPPPGRCFLHPLHGIRGAIATRCPPALVSRAAGVVVFVRQKSGLMTLHIYAPPVLSGHGE